MKLSRNNFFRIVTGVIFLIFILIIILANKESKNRNSNKIVPVVSADKSPIKIKPEDEGGIDIPFKDTSIYSSLDKGGEKKRYVKSEEVINNISDAIKNIENASAGSVTEKTVIKNTAEKKEYRVQLGSFKTYSQAKNAWDKLKKSNESLLKKCNLYIDKKDGNYRVQTSLVSKQEANNICVKIGNCFVLKGF